MDALNVILSDPHVGDAAHWLKNVLVNDIEAYPANIAVKLVLDKVVRFAGNALGHESLATAAKGLSRLRPFGEKVVEKLNAEVESGRVTAGAAREALESPEGVRVVNAAMSAAVLTDDEVTIDTLAAMVAELARHGAGSRLSLHLRQAAEVVENLQPRHLHVLAQLFLACETPVPGNIWPGDVERDQDERLRDFDTWARGALDAAAAATVRPCHDDLIELEASRLALRTNEAASFDSKMRPSGSRVAQRLAQAGVYVAVPYTLRALTMLERLEFGEDTDLRHDLRDFSRPALGAYSLAGAGFVLATIFLRERGIRVGINLQVWADDRGLVHETTLS